MTFGNVGTVKLPESRLSVNLGVGLFPTPDMIPFEGHGFKPDLWVYPGDSVDRVIKFIQQYGLAEQQALN